MNSLEKSNIYKKSNELVQKFKHELSLKEMKLLNYMIASIGSQRYDTEFNTLVFDINDFYRELGMERKLSSRDYTEMEDLIYKLYQRDSGWVDVYEKRTILKWIEKPTIDPATNRLTLKLDNDLKPYLLGLEKGYFQAEYQYTKKMTSKYSLRLYELLKSWEKVKHGKKEWGIDELKVLIDATSDSLSNYAEFKRNVLDKAVKEINSITDLYVTYEVTEKVRRKVTKLLFHFRKKTNDFIEVEYDEVENTPFDDLCEYVEIKTKKNKTILEELINIYVESSGIDKNAYIKKKMIDIKLADNIKTNKHAYLLGIIRNDIKNATANAKPVRTEIIPDWFKKQQAGEEEEFEPASEEEIEAFKKSLEELDKLEKPFEQRKEELQAKLKSKYGKGKDNE